MVARLAGPFDRLDEMTTTIWPSQPTRFTTFDHGGLEGVAAVSVLRLGLRRIADGGRMTAGLVLVIDDEPLVRTSLSRFLQLKGYTIVVAADGPRGLALVDEHPDLRAVILDITMPGMSGLDVLAAIRVRRPQLAVLLSTADADAPADLADGFLAKPYSPETLVAVLEAAVAAVAARR